MRKAEKAGESILFPKVKCAVKACCLVFLVVFCSIYLPYLFLEIKLPYMIAGFIVGVTAGLYLLDAILNQSWSAFFQNGKRQIGYIGFSIVIMGIIYGYPYSQQYHGFENLPPKDSSIEELVEDGFVVFNMSMVTFLM